MSSANRPNPLKSLRATGLTQRSQTNGTTVPIAPTSPNSNASSAHSRLPATRPSVNGPPLHNAQSPQAVNNSTTAATSTPTPANWIVRWLKRAVLVFGIIGVVFAGIAFWPAYSSMVDGHTSKNFGQWTADKIG